MKITLAVTQRDKSTKNAVLRSEGRLPAIVYGPKQEPINICLNEKEFDKIRKEAGESTIIELSGLEQPIEVLIKGIDFNPVQQKVLHVDFYAIEKGKEMTTHVALNFIGQSPAESQNIGSIMKVLHEVEVTCMPADLPSSIDVDLSALETLVSKIIIKDLPVITGVKITTGADEMVATVAANKEEEEEDSVPAAVDMDAIEVEKKGKEETEEAE